MARINRHSRLNAPPQKNPHPAVLVFQGVLVSLVVSLVAIVFLSLISLTTETTFVEKNMKYIMVAVTTVSIFIGSVYATQRASSMGLLIGVAIGLIYVLFSVGVGLELNNDSPTLLSVVNKVGAGIAAGALGGIIGVNL